MYNNKVQGTFFLTDNDGIKHEICIGVLANMEDSQFIVTVAFDG